jgi:hypothetical protein
MHVIKTVRSPGIARHLTAVGLAVAATLAFCVAPVRAEFGVSVFDQQITANAGGEAFSRAGGHPYAITTTINLNTFNNPNLFGLPAPEANVHDVITELPPGLLGNPAGIPQCAAEQLVVPGSSLLLKSPECPVASQVGTAHVATEISSLFTASGVFPVFNMVPPASAPAEFGFLVGGVPITLTGNVRNGGDFGVDVISHNIPITLPFDGITLTLWGNPADKSHDSQRCDVGGFGFPDRGNPICAEGEGVSGPNAYPLTAQAFLTLPTQCTAPGVGMKTTLKVDPWREIGVYKEYVLYNHVAPAYPSPMSEWGPQQALEGCDSVPFQPGFSAQATSHEAASPTGLNIDLSLPQDGLLNPAGIATADLKDTTIELPRGMAVSPSAAHGLAGCSEAQLGLGNGEEAKCPDASKIGSVEIVTPLLEEPMHGAMYLATQGSNPFDSLFALYLVAEEHGVRIKLPGRVDLDPATGQLTSSFSDAPQLPFSELKIALKSGPRAPLVTPEACGTYTAKAVLTPWSGNAPVTRESSFSITSGPGGSPCPAAPFSPSFVAGELNNRAGSFSPFSLTFSRQDGEQELGGITVKTPPGLIGMLSKVSRCGEAQANAGTCGPDSQIGTTQVGVGDGVEPYWVSGKVYLTEAYGGGQFGLSVVVPAIAGPFDLGLVVVRAAIHVDPRTAALTIVANQLPSMLQGIPLQVKTVHVEIDRPEFMLNPTSCAPMSVDATIGSTAGVSAATSSRFQSADCSSLAFEPKLTASTSAHVSRKNGASLNVKLTYPKGGEANIHAVKVKLPKQLASRLTTLQQACPDRVFDANPGSCPAGSIVGSAIAHTPILKAPLQGPAYFVSHGGAKFPELTIVLQSEGVSIVLGGETFIDPHTDVTSSTFRTIPDAPVSTFELLLPQGSHSALGSQANLCKTKLVMPTQIVGQNGAIVKQTTKIAVKGCAKHPVKHGARRKRGK